MYSYKFNIHSCWHFFVVVVGSCVVEFAINLVHEIDENCRPGTDRPASLLWTPLAKALRCKATPSFLNPHVGNLITTRSRKPKAAQYIIGYIKMLTMRPIICGMYLRLENSEGCWWEAGFHRLWIWTNNCMGKMMRWIMIGRKGTTCFYSYN